MASASKKESTNKLLRSLLLAEKNGLPMEKLAGEYHGLVGEPLPYWAFGYKTLELYLRSIPEVVTLRRNPDGTLQCIGVADESTQHIKSLVTRQRSAKKSKPKRSRPKPMLRSRPRLRRAGPLYKPPLSRPAAFPRPSVRRAPAPAWPSASKSTAPSSSYPVRPLSSTYKSATSAKTQESTQRSTSAISKPPLKNSFSNRNEFNTYERTEPTRYKDASRAQVPSSPPPSVHSGSLANKSAFISVVSQEEQSLLSASTSSKQHKSQQAPRVLAPRFLKQIQEQMKEQRFKDMEKEQQRKQQARQLAVEHNNNNTQVTHADQHQELRITVTNDLNKEEDNNNESTQELPSREEWPSRRQIVRQSGDWRSPPPEEQSVTPVSNSSSREEHRSNSPIVPSSQSPVTVAPSAEDGHMCKWFKKELESKNSGLWRSSLEKDFKKEFGSTLTDEIIEKMANLKIITSEKVFNQEIVYPNLKVETSSNDKRRVIVETSSSDTRNAVVNGSTSNNSIHRQSSSGSGSALPVDRASPNPPPLQRSTSAPSDTSTSEPTLQFVQSQSPVQSPTPTSPSPTLKSSATIGKGDPSVPDYSHLAVPLPEEEQWEVYVSYIKHLQDFYVLIIDEEYSDKLFTLEEEMSHYYKYSRRRLQGPAAPGCMYVAELNKEWLRVMVDTVHCDYANCFLVDHGDAERIEIKKLQPLAPQFLRIPFQAIPCKLEGTEDDPENMEAVQKFCEVALGRVLTAEVISKEDAQVELILYEEDAVATVNDLCLSCV